MKKLQFTPMVNKLREEDRDIKNRTIPCGNERIELFYISQLVDKTALAEFVVKPLVQHCATSSTISPELAMQTILQADECTLSTDQNEVMESVLQGFIVVLFSSSLSFVVINLKKVEKRTTTHPQVSYTLRGPQDSFTENLDANLSLIRYRLKDKNLRIKTFQVGRRTKSRVAMLYIDDIVNKNVVKELSRRINAIDVDAIGESGELQACIMGKNSKLLPTIGLIERSDFAFHTLAEGKVILLIDGSGLALSAPKVFAEFFHSCDDIYDNKYFGMFSRLFRYFCAIYTLTATSLFVAITSFHTDVLPTDYAIMLAEMRANVPFNALMGAFLLEFLIELLRESLLRVPKQIGSAIGIVGAIVIGQAAIAAGIFSPLLIIIASSGLLSSFAIPDFSLVNPLRILKFGMLILTGLFGFYGFTLGLTYILAELVSMESFGVPYMAPYAPFNAYDFNRTLMDNITISPFRPHYVRAQNKMRTKSLPKS